MIGRHVLAGLLACCLVAGGLAGARWYVRAMADAAIHAVAPRMFSLKNQGTMLQADAFRQPDLLVVYGSSEMEQANPYHASRVFATYPTGFDVFPVGRGSTTSLIILEDVAAVGGEIRGKKVAISLSPPWFLLHDRTPNFYAANHSDLHLSALVFSTDLSYATRQAAIRQLLQSPSLFDSSALVAQAATRLASDAPLDRVLYTALLPLGKIHTAWLELQDAWATFTYLRAEPAPAVDRGQTRIDWGNLTFAADIEQRAAADNNEFGFDNDVWNEKYRKLVTERRGQFSDAWFLDNLAHTAEWTDLRILLAGLRELGAQPLLLSQPIPGKYQDYVGVSAAARGEYYRRLRQVAAEFGVPLVDFADHDADIYFVTDPNSHLSRKGWTYYDRALDAFYHESLGQLASTEWRAAALLPGDPAGAADDLR